MYSIAVNQKYKTVIERSWTWELNLYELMSIMCIDEIYCQLCCEFEFNRIIYIHTHDVTIYLNINYNITIKYITCMWVYVNQNQNNYGKAKPVALMQRRYIWSKYCVSILHARQSQQVEIEWLRGRKVTRIFYLSFFYVTLSFSFLGKRTMFFFFFFLRDGKQNMLCYSLITTISLSQNTITY